jgi:hypothetical protein
VSFGWLSKESDCDALIEFLRNEFLDKVDPSLLSSVSDDDAQAQEIRPGATDSSQLKTNVVEKDISISHLYVYPVKSCAGNLRV